MTWDPRAFRRLCREADARVRKTRRAEPDERLRRLMEPGVTLDRAWWETNHPWRAEGRAAESVVEALMLALRRGLDAIKHPDNQRRLRELSDAQMREVAERVQKLMPHIAPAWKSEDVQALISLWSRLRCRP